jgi:hypothetical protein
VLQLPLWHPAQPEDAPLMRLLAAPLSPPLLKPQTDIILWTSPDWHFGQLTASSLLKTSFSKHSEQLQHSYSNIGIETSK